jgi:hypothetical protein
LVEPSGPIFKLFDILSACVYILYVAPNITAGLWCSERRMREKSFEGLYGVPIGRSRVISIYDKSSNQYNLLFKTIAKGLSGPDNRITYKYLDLPLYIQFNN